MLQFLFSLFALMVSRVKPDKTKRKDVFEEKVEHECIFCKETINPESLLKVAHENCVPQEFCINIHKPESVCSSCEEIVTGGWNCPKETCQAEKKKLHIPFFLRTKYKTFVHSCVAKVLRKTDGHLQVMLNQSFCPNRGAGCTASLRLWELQLEGRLSHFYPLEESTWQTEDERSQTEREWDNFEYWKSVWANTGDRGLKAPSTSTLSGSLTYSVDTE